MGWEYVCDLTPYLDIYRCDDPAAPELNTDEETLHQVLDKKLKSQILWSIALICLIPVWLYVVVLRGVPGFSGICDMLLNGYGGLFLCAALLVLSWLIDSIACIIGAVTTRRRRLLQRTRRSPAQLRRWRAIRLSAHLLPLAALALCLVLLVPYTRSGRDIPVADFPAPTVSEVFPGMQSSRQWATVTPEPLSRHRYLRQKDLTLSNFYDGGYYDVDVYRIAWTWRRATPASRRRKPARRRSPYPAGSTRGMPRTRIPTAGSCWCCRTARRSGASAMTEGSA